MKVSIIPSGWSDAAASTWQYLTSFLVNDTVAFDAGSLGFYRGPAEQAAVRHLFLSHSHIDHVASLPIFLENVFDLSPAPVAIYASAAVQASLRSDLFNGRVWPNFLDMADGAKRFAVVRTIEHGQSVEVEGLRVTAVSVDHVVPTLGYVIEDQSAAVVIVSDTGPTEAIWQAARNVPNLKAVFLEATFPDELATLAQKTKHLTPAGFAAEVRKLARPATFFAVHLRARYRDQLLRELLAHRLANLKIAQLGTVYEF